MSSHRPRPGRSRRCARIVWATVPGLGLVLAACGHSYAGSTLSEQVTSWATSSSPTFAASVSAIEGDLRRIKAAAGDPGSLPADCDLLVTDVLNANQSLPAPDQTLTNLLAKAYADAGDAGHDCVPGTRAQSGQLARSAVESSAARRDLIRALARFDSVTTP